MSKVQSKRTKRLLWATITLAVLAVAGGALALAVENYTGGFLDYTWEWLSFNGGGLVMYGAGIAAVICCIFFVIEKWKDSKHVSAK